VVPDRAFLRRRGTILAGKGTAVGDVRNARQRRGAERT